MFSRMKAAAPPADPSTDIEDFGRVPVQNPATRHLATVTRKGKGKGRDVEEEEEVEEELPDARVDYSGWIRVMRKRWKKQREEKTTVKQTGGQASTSQNRGSVSSMFRQRTHGLSSLAWEVVQISPSNRLGVFNLWLSIDGNFQKVKLKVPRQFYLNLRTPPEKGTFNRRYSAQPLVRTLPRNHPCLHLFQVTVDEDDYVQEESHFSNLINNPNVDGVYELQVRSFHSHACHFFFLHLEP
jgi:DNA polymerase epsilon subunit 1